MKRRIYMFFRVFFLVAIIIVAALLLIMIFCSVKTYTFEGSTLYSDDDLKKYVVTERYDTNTIGAWVMSMIRPKKGIPFVEKVKIRPTGLNSVKVTIKEKELSGVMDASDGRYVYYDSRYKVAEVSERLIEGVRKVMVTGYTKGPVAGGEIPLEDGLVKTLSVLESELKKREITVDLIKLSDDGSITLMKGSVEIRLGQKANLSEKIMRLPYILPNVENQSGILHVEDFSEENTDIVFEKT